MIREAQKSDAEAITHLLRQLGYPASRDEMTLRIRKFKKIKTEKLYLAIVEEQIAGLIAIHFMDYFPTGKRMCRITALVVDESKRKCGIGKKLLTFAEGRAKALDCLNIELTSSQKRKGAHHFYLSCDYKNSSLRFAKLLSQSK